MGGGVEGEVRGVGSWCLGKGECERIVGSMVVLYVLMLEVNWITNTRIDRDSRSKTVIERFLIVAFVLGIEPSLLLMKLVGRIQQGVKAPLRSLYPR